MSTYLIAVAIAWVIAQGGKFLISSLRRKEADYKQLYTSGSMPSGHSAIVVSLMTIIGLTNGVDSAVFAVTVVFAAIVMYDAVMVRRSSGEQGIAIQSLIEEQKSNVKVPRAAKGHEPLEVAVGALIGFIVGFAVFFVAH